MGILEDIIAKAESMTVEEYNQLYEESKAFDGINLANLDEIITDNESNYRLIVAISDDYPLLIKPSGICNLTKYLKKSAIDKYKNHGLIAGDFVASAEEIELPQNRFSDDMEFFQTLPLAA